MTHTLERPIDRVTLADGLVLEDDWFAVKRLDIGTLAIGEPGYHQCNWSYLISDGQESLLWDTGSGRRAIAPLVARHGGARITAFPSHMHYDHLGGIESFGLAMVADLPMLRAVAEDEFITPSERMFLGGYEDLEAPRFAVGRWVAPGETVTVGERHLKVLHTPGHSPDSVSLWEPDRARLFAADFVYRGDLYAQTPDASLPDYQVTLRKLLKMLPKDVEIVCAHGQEEQGCFDMPTLGFGDLEDVLSAVDAVLTTAPHAGERQVNDHMVLLFSAESFAA